MLPLPLLLVVKFPLKTLAASPHRKTTQGVDVEPYTIVTGPQDWVADDFRGEANAHKWQYILTDADIIEIEAALKSIVEKGIKIEVRP